MQVKDDADVVRDGRTKVLKDTEDLTVVVPLRDKIVDKLVKKLEEQGEGIKTVDLWLRGNSERQEWLNRAQLMSTQIDEFIEPIYDATNDWSSTLHLPITYTVCKTYHARMLAALLGIDPPFTVKSRQAANSDRALLIQELMRYTLQSWINKHQGIEDVIDAWLWSWVTQGSGVLKARWERAYTRFVDVVEEEETVGSAMLPDAAGGLVSIPTKAMKEVEKEVVIETFSGPRLEFVRNEEVLIIGGDGDPQEADEVLHSDYSFTASRLWSLVDQGIFRESAVKKAIAGGETMRSADPANGIQVQGAAISGQGTLDTDLDHKRYQVIERYARIDVDGSGIASDVILWVHADSKEILRATYLYRVMKTGLRPFFKIDFHKRFGSDNGVGLPELLYSLAREIDAVHNMKMDFGLISSMPMGFYRATSSLSEERIPLEPGALVPLDNPQTDVFFPQMGNRTSFTAQEEQVLQQQIERMTSISDISLGIVGGQGAARTATGARALLGESNANLDVYLRRMNRGWKRAMVYLFHMLQERIEPGFQFRVLGDDGSMYWETMRSREEIAGEYDFELEANSANSNKTIQMEQAAQLVQLTSNPLDYQLGIITPLERFEALKTQLQTMGVKDFARYIRKPAGQMRIYSPEEIANATLAGVDLKLDPSSDLQGFLDYFAYILDHDELLGQFSTTQTVALARKASEAEQMLSAVQAQSAQNANAQQMQTNASMASSPTPQGAGMAAVGTGPAAG